MTPPARIGKPSPVRTEPGSPAQVSLARQIGLGLGLVLVGIVVGLFAAFAHAQRAGEVPVGLPMALGGAAAVVVAVGVLTGSRGAAALPGIGWLISVLILASPRSEGDLIVSGDGPGLAYLGGGLVLLGGLSALPYGRLKPVDRREHGRPERPNG